jgi:hypothetical protein
MGENFAFHRAPLAEAFCDSLQGKGIANATSGLFLAGPRRVGKSTFLIEDLMPAAQARGCLTVYVDLWENKQADPSLLIVEAVKKNIASYSGKIEKLAKQVHLQQINVLKILELDFMRPGLPENITLADAIQYLHQLSDKPVMLLIDEAQHALTTANGINTMFAIKSARDQMNRSHQTPHLMLVFTGSNRDKLAQLVVKKEQPFFGSEVTAFPLLGKDYTDFFIEKVNKSLALNNQFSQESVWQTFQLIGHRPEILRQITANAAIYHQAQSFSSVLVQNASVKQTQIWEQFESDFHALTPLHQAILTLLIQQGRAWSPFSDSSMQCYKQAISQETLSVSSVQTAIQYLREQGFIWQSSRGVYVLEDDSFVQWFKDDSPLKGNDNLSSRSRY